MDKKLINFGKWILSFLYVLYVINIIINVVLMQRGVNNGMIDSYGAFGYIITYGLSLLIACGFFVGSTIVQLIFYHIKKKSVSKCLIVLIIFEVIKIIGNSIYIYMIDYANIQRGSTVTAFIISGMILFAIISVLEVALMILMKISERSEFCGKTNNG